MGQIVNSLLQGEEFDASVEIAERRARNGDGADGDDDEDATMEDVNAGVRSGGDDDAGATGATGAGGSSESAGGTGAGTGPSA